MENYLEFLKAFRDSLKCIHIKQPNSTIILSCNISYDGIRSDYSILQDIDFLTSYSTYSKQIIEFATKHIENLPPIILSDASDLVPQATKQLITVGDFESNKGKSLFIHELTHYIMYMIYDNETKPYPYEGHYIQTEYKKAFKQTVQNFADLIKSKVSYNLGFKIELGINAGTPRYKAFDDIHASLNFTTLNEEDHNLSYIFKTTSRLALFSGTISEHDRYLFKRLSNFAGSIGEHDEELIVLLPEFHSFNFFTQEELETLKPLEEFWETHISPMLEL